MFEDFVPSPHLTWTQRVLHHLDRAPDRAAVVDVTPAGPRAWTGVELRSMTVGAIDLLDDAGVPPGQPVPALVANRPSSIALLLAGALSARPLAPLAPRMTRAELLACLAGLPGPVLLAEPATAAVAAPLAAATGKRVVVVDGELSGTRVLVAGTDPGATALVLHTSGTTGLPKQVAVAESPLGRRADVNGYLLDLHPGDGLVTTALFHHVGALGNIAVGMGNGAAVVTFPTFSVAAWQALDMARPTHAVTIPSVFEMLLAAGALSSSSLRVLGYGSSPIHPDTMRRIQQVMPDVAFVNLFGQTEGSPLTVLTAQDHRDAAAGRPELLTSVGRAAPGTELRVHDPDPTGVGEVWARAPHSFVVDAEGWQHTGDLGHLVDGYLHLVGRRGDKIIRGGENVYPLEVEQVLQSHPAVREAAVVGVADRRLGETVKAFIVPEHPADPPDVELLRRYVRERLAGFKVPTLWDVIDDLPRNSSGKVVRRALVPDP